MLKKIIPAFLLACVLGNDVYSQAKKNYEVTAVAFYNFENYFDTDDDPKNWGDDEFLPNGPYAYTQTIFEEKTANLARVINELATEIVPDGPALIGTAEIENANVLQHLVEHPTIKRRNYQFVHFDGPDSRGIDVALLYNPKYFKVLSAQSLLTDISKVGASKGSRTRDVLYVRGILSGDTVNVFVNHWPSRRGGEAVSAPLRAIAANVSKRVMDSLTKINPAAKVIIMGDLNDDPVSPSVAKVLGAKGDKEKVSVSGLYNPWMKFYKSGYGTLGYNDSWNLFDQIIISGGFLQDNTSGWRYYKAEIFKRDYMITQYGQYKGYPLRSFSNNTWNYGFSDHFPTIIYLLKEKK